MQRKGETEMTREEAIRILDPETTAEALAEIEYYNGFNGKTAAVQAVSDACVLAVAALREQEQRRWIPVTERLPEKNKEVVGWYKDNPFSPFRYGIVSWNGHGWVFTYAQRYVDAVTYWIPMPEPPKEETT